MPTLYLVPTPLSDPDDITLRALRVLREVRAVAAPDESARARLDAYDIPTPIIAYADALAALDHGDVALISTGGTPALGGAAHDLVMRAIARGVRIEPLPGASAEITALVLSGLPTDAFVLFGRIPADAESYAREPATMIFAAAEVISALDQLIAALGAARPACVAARLTQPDEIAYRAPLGDALAYFRDEPPILDAWIVVAGAPPEAEPVWDEARVRAELRRRLQSGEQLKVAAKAIAASSGWDRRAVYALGVDEKQR